MRMKLNQSQRNLRERIIQVLKEQGFKINPHVRPRGCSKTTYRRIQQKARLEQLSLHKNFLVNSTKIVKNYCRDGSEIIPESYGNRAILTIILSPGEFISSIPLEQPQQPWHLMHGYRTESGR